MSYFTEIVPVQPSAQRIGTSLRGATGLSRAALAAMYRHDGFFGRDSDLSAAEQAIVQSRLGPVPGIAPRPATTWLTPRLRVLAAYADALIAGDNGERQRAGLEARGFRPAAISEVRTVVEDVREIFGPLAGATAGEPLVIAADYARAA